MNIGGPISTIAIIDSNGLMQQNFRAWVNAVTAESTLIGIGSPEGVITANPTRQYMDSTGSTGSILYIKKTGSDKTGWVLV